MSAEALGRRLLNKLEVQGFDEVRFVDRSIK